MAVDGDTLVSNFIFSYYASTAFPPRLAPPLKRPRLMPPARSQHPKQQKQQPATNTATVPDLNQLKVYSKYFFDYFFFLLYTYTYIVFLIHWRIAKFFKFTHRYVRYGNWNILESWFQKSNIKIFFSFFGNKKEFIT